MLSCKKQRIVVVQRSTAQGIAANFMDTTMQQASLLCSTEEISIFSLLMLLNFTECFYFVNIFLTVLLLILECNILAFKVKV